MKQLVSMKARIAPLLLFVGSVQACDFDCTLQRHLQALESHDWAAFEATLGKQQLPLILPNGALSLDGKSYRDLLQPWFAEGGWTFKAKELHREVGSDLALVLLDVDYDEADRGGKPYHLDHYLSLVFRNTDGEWRLVFDQNTSQPPPKPEPANEANAADARTNAD